jgi:hypothetical protein
MKICQNPFLELFLYGNGVYWGISQMPKSMKALLLGVVIVLNVIAIGGSGTASAAPSTALAAPGISGPADGARIPYESQPFVFNWNPVAGATNYILQIGTNLSFNPLTINNIVISDGWAAKTPLAPATYYWRVATSDGISIGAWSTVRSVKVLAPDASLAPMAFQRAYANNSPWNTLIGSSPIYDPHSNDMIALLKQTRNGGAITSDPTWYTYPVYWANQYTPRRTVYCIKYGCAISVNGAVTRVDVLTGVPIPNGAQPSTGTDAQMIVIDTVTGAEYGFYHMAVRSDQNWQADNGYQYSVYDTAVTPMIGARAAGIPYYAGLIRPWEIRQGHIDHAIAFAYEFTKSSKCVFPATKSGGSSTNTYAMPVGTRIQLNPALTTTNLANMGLSATGRIIARALQRYGMIVVDTGGSPKIMVENLEDNPLTTESWLSLGLTRESIWGIPYDQFRVLALPAGYWGSTAPNWASGCYR